MLQVELSRFRVLEGKSSKVDEWLAFLNDHMEEVLLTLDGEKMYVETIFREVWQGNEYLYWYSVRGEGGTAVEDSESEIDKRHLDYWQECIDPEFGCVDLSPEVVMIPHRIRSAMENE